MSNRDFTPDRDETRFVELLEKYLQGEISRGDLAEFEGHLAGDPQHRELLVNLSLHRTLLPRALEIKVGKTEDVREQESGGGETGEPEVSASGFFAQKQGSEQDSGFGIQDSGVGSRDSGVGSQPSALPEDQQRKAESGKREAEKLSALRVCEGIGLDIVLRKSH